MRNSSIQKILKHSVLFSILLSFLVFSTSCGDSGGKSAGTAPADNSASTEPTNYAEGEVLVKYKLSAFSSDKLSYLSADVSSAVLSKELTLLGVTAIEPVLPLAIKKASAYAANATAAISDLDRLRKLTLAADISVESIIKTLAADPDIEYAQPNFVYSTDATTNDPLLPQLWGLKNTGQQLTLTSGPALTVGAGCVGFTCSVLPDSVAVSGADIGVIQAWDINTGDANQIIAIIDSGVDYTHPDLVANIWTNPGEIAGDGIDNDANGYIDDIHGYNFAGNSGDSMDDNGHGTHIAGTIAGDANNNVGVVGINHQAKIMGLKFLAADGYGTTDDAIRAIEYADSFGVKITNNSWGGIGYDQALYDAISLSNSLFIVAAGNSGWDNDRGNVPSGLTAYPGSFDLPNLITVSATDNEDKIAGFSSYGLDTSEVGAPGVAILSTAPTGTCQLCDNNSPGYTFLSGTSMATPHVVGAMSLIVSNWSGLTNDQYRTILEQSVDDIPSLHTKVSSGRINVNNALRSTYLIKNITPKQNVLAGSIVTYSIQLSSLAGAAANLNLSLDTGNPLITGSLSQNIAAIAVNGSEVITAQLSVSGSLSQGKYKIKVNASDFNGIQASAYLLLEVLPDRDLVFTSVSIPTGIKVDGGDQFVVNTSVTNIGTVGVTSSFAVSFFLSTDQNAADEAQYKIGGFRINRLAGGATYTSSSTVTLPISSTATLGVPLGNYYIRAVMDSYENVIELIEANNTAFSANTITVANEADLVVTSVSAAKTSYFTGEYSTFNVTIKNQGATGVVSPCMLAYLSTDTTITTADSSITQSLTCHYYLAAGASTTRSVSVKISNGQAPGSYFIGAIVDPNNSVIETNESNNGGAGASVQVVRDIDVTVNSISVSSTTLAAAGGVRVNWTLKNLGQSTTIPDRWFAGYLYLSTDSNITTADTYLGFQASTDLSGGAISRDWSKFVYIPGGTASGNYYIGVIADPSNVQPESNESNNTASVAVTIQ